MNSVFSGVLKIGPPENFVQSLPPPAVPVVSQPTPLGFYKVSPPDPYQNWVGQWYQFYPVGESNAVVQVVIPKGRTLKEAFIALNGNAGTAWSTFNDHLFPIGVILNGVTQNSSYTFLNISGPSLYLAFTMITVPGGGLAGHYIDCIVILDDGNTVTGSLYY